MDNPEKLATQHWVHKAQDEDKDKTKNTGYTRHRTKTKTKLKTLGTQGTERRQRQN